MPPPLSSVRTSPENFKKKFGILLPLSLPPSSLHLLEPI